MISALNDCENKEKQVRATYQHVWVAEHGEMGKPGASGSAEGPHKRRSERVLQQ